MNPPRSRMPDFIGVGPPRTATTWLHEVLRGRVTFPSGIKETDYFRENYQLGREWYLAHFPDCPPDRPVGEICPTYFDSPDASKRIRNDIPGCKIICTLRDPVERMHSHYRMLRREGLLGRAINFERAVKRDRRWSGPGNLLESSRYANHLRRWIDEFGSDRTLILLHDDLEDNPRAFLEAVRRFIGVERFDLPVSRALERVNRAERAPRSDLLATTARKARMWMIRHQLYSIYNGAQAVWDRCAGGGEPFPPMDPALEAGLRSELADDIDMVATILGRDLSKWKRPHNR